MSAGLRPTGPAITAGPRAPAVARTAPKQATLPPAARALGSRCSASRLAGLAQPKSTTLRNSGRGVAAAAFDGASATAIMATTSATTASKAWPARWDVVDTGRLLRRWEAICPEPGTPSVMSAFRQCLGSSSSGRSRPLASILLAMTLQALALIGLAGLFGPLVALPRAGIVPLVIGELAAGLALGTTGARVLHAGNSTFTFLADIGFALIMFVAGTHVPVRDPRLRGALSTGLVRAVAVGVFSAGAGWGISEWFGTGHAALYAVLMASSSAALILPVVDSLKLSGPSV